MSVCIECDWRLMPRTHWRELTDGEKAAHRKQGIKPLYARSRCQPCYKIAKERGDFTIGDITFAATCATCGDDLIGQTKWTSYTAEERAEMRANGIAKRVSRDSCEKCYNQARRRDRSGEKRIWTEEEIALTGGRWEFCPRRRVQVWIEAA